MSTGVSLVCYCLITFLLCALFVFSGTVEYVFNFSSWILQIKLFSFLLRAPADLQSTTFSMMTRALVRTTFSVLSSTCATRTQGAHGPCLFLPQSTMLISPRSVPGPSWTGTKTGTCWLSRSGRLRNDSGWSWTARVTMHDYQVAPLGKTLAGAIFLLSVWPSSRSNFYLGASPSNFTEKYLSDQSLCFWGAVFIGGNDFDGYYQSRDFLTRGCYMVL